MLSAPEDFKLGKLDHKHDERTLRMAEFIDTTLPFPKQFDFDHDRRPFPNNVWGNNAWGDCVKAGQTNHLLRLERLETYRTVPITDEEVVEEYKRECEREFGHAPESPGDANDNGLVVLYNLRNWRNVGWKLGTRTYTIAAYGELEASDHDQLCRGIWYMHGVQFGLSLPRTAIAQVNSLKWDDTGKTSSDAEPGSWGGHLVYAKRYTSDGLIYCKSWALDIAMTPAFLTRYADEAWVVVDTLDEWRNKPGFDIAAMEQKLQDIGARSKNQ